MVLGMHWLADLIPTSHRRTFFFNLFFFNGGFRDGRQALVICDTRKTYTKEPHPQHGSPSVSLYSCQPYFLFLEPCHLMEEKNALSLMCALSCLSVPFSFYEG